MKYSSRDFYLSSVLLSCGCTINSLNREQRNFVQFVFNDSPEKCHEIIAEYWAGGLLVDPKKLISSINELKTRIHEGS